MNVDEILKKATPRPWGSNWKKAMSRIEKELNRKLIEADVELIMLAVNAYERQREAIRELYQALREADHALFEHHDVSWPRKMEECGRCPTCAPSNATTIFYRIDAVLAKAKELL